jgi:indolepyruvate ferredoxin oxidoreductase beta subunit
MGSHELPKDPYNVIIAGVGGQGNVLASRLIGRILNVKGYEITIGETFGASQRGGSVMSHLRVSKDRMWSPQIPKGEADLVIAIEPSEALRVMADYGSPRVIALVNDRPVHSTAVISGREKYPELNDLEKAIRELSAEAWLLSATDEAMVLGKAIYTNIIMVGALSGIDLLPVDREAFETVFSNTMTPDKLAVNLKAFDIGFQMTVQ